MAVAGKVAIVTGGGSGIGEATARMLAAEGVNIVVADLNMEAATKVAESITSEGKARALPFKANVASMDDAEALVNFTLEKFGEVSILINNAGVVRDTLIPTMTRDQWDLVLDVNLGGCFNLMHACARPMMQKRYGRIRTAKWIMLFQASAQAGRSPASARC